jgi:hypothetical protein
MATQQERQPRRPAFVVHPGVAHTQAMVRSLPERTGRSLDEWMALLRAAGVEGRRDQVAWLQKEYGLTKVTATLVSDAERGEPGFDASDPEADVDAQYAGPKAGLRAIYEALMDAAGALGDDVTATPCATFVPLRRRYVFAQIRPSTRTRVDLGLALARFDGELPERVVPTGGKEKGDRITHRIELRSAAEVDGEVVRWLRTAYELDG